MPRPPDPTAPPGPDLPPEIPEPFPRDRSGALGAGRVAAFHGRPGDGIAFLRGVPGPEATWLLGVCLGAAGRYGEAFEVLGDVERTAPPSRWPSLMASTLGSLHRQLGRHEAARAHDLAALDLADDFADARIDALLGLAADAVGIGDVSAASSWWEQAADRKLERPGTGAPQEVSVSVPLRGSSGPVPPDGAGWRGRVRVNWVEAEIALMQGRPQDAVAPALAAVEQSRDARARRHEAKSLMFAGVALAESPGDTGHGLALLRIGLSEAVGLGCDPLVRPIGAYLASVTGDEEAARAASDATARIVAGLPAGLIWP